MAIQQHPFTSGSHWRIPAPGRRATSRTRTRGHTGLRAWVTRQRGHASALAPVALGTALELVTLGGVFVAPLAALAALVTLFTPGSDSMRPLAAPLIVGAAIWLALAILCAHGRHTGAPSGGHDPKDGMRP